MTYDKWKTTEPMILAEDLEITDEREELYAEIERLRASNAGLLDAATAVVALVEAGVFLPNGAVMMQLKSAIAKAETS